MNKLENKIQLASCVNSGGTTCIYNITREEHSRYDRANVMVNNGK